MGEYTTAGGLVVTDRRHSRSLVPHDDPRSWPPNDNGPGPNTPPQSVGPTSSEGFGNTHVMYPAAHAGAPYVQAWSGWPVEWNTPNWQSSTGLADILAKVSTVFGAIDLNSTIVAAMPPYRMQGNRVVEELPWMRNPQPEVYSGWTEAMKQVVASYWGGEAFLWCTSRYADGTVRTWVMLNPAWVEIEMHGQVRRHTMGGLDITDDVLHLRYASWPGDPHGHGPLEALAWNLFGAQALERYQAGLAVRGGIPWGVLTAPGNLSAPQAMEMRENFVASRMSAMGAPAILSGGVTLTPFTISPKDMALLELRQFDEARIAMLLGVPPELLGLPGGKDSLTYATTEGLRQHHWQAYLRPHVAAIMEGISQWAVVSTQRVEVNRDEYLRPSFGERIDGYVKLFNLIDPANGERVISREEIRTAERLDAVMAPSPTGAR